MNRWRACWVRPGGWMSDSWRQATVASTIFIKHPLKTQEMKLKYRLVKDAAAWKVVDVTVLGSSMLTDIRDTQVKPLMAQGGWDKLLSRMREELAKK